jgi:hypothetical protein
VRPVLIQAAQRRLQDLKQLFTTFLPIKQTEENDTRLRAQARTLAGGLRSGSSKNALF